MNYIISKQLLEQILAVMNEIPGKLSYPIIKGIETTVRPLEEPKAEEKKVELPTN